MQLWSGTLQSSAFNLTLLWWPAMFLSVASFAIGLPLQLAHLNQITEQMHRIESLLNMLICIGYSLAAMLLLWLRPRDPMVRFLVLTLVSVGVVESGMTDDLIRLGISNPGVGFITPLAYVMRALEMGCGLLMLYIYPEGQFQPTWTRNLAVIWVLLLSLWLVFPGIWFNVLDGITWRKTIWISLAFSALWLLSGVIAWWTRLRLSHEHRGVGRSMLLASMCVLFYYVAGLIPGLGTMPGGMLQTVLLAFSLLSVPLNILVAMVRHRLHDGERLVARAITLLLLTILIGGLHLTLVFSLVEAFALRDALIPSVLGTVLVMLVLTPLRDWLQRGVNRWLYGERNRPIEILQKLSAQLELATTPLAALTRLSDVTVNLLKLQYLAVRLKSDHGVPLIERGLITPYVETFALKAEGQTVGVLVVGAGAPLGNDLRAMLTTVAQQAGSAAQAHFLSAQVMASRERLVRAREEERRRLRRDLHDGLGPTLAAQQLKLGAARVALYDVKRVDALLLELENGVERAIAEVRQVVDELRPPAIDDLGLFEAIHQRVQDLTGGSGIKMTLDFHGPLPELLAAVEVASYRIVIEAVMNVLKHAQAQACQIELKVLETSLWITVQDDGIGQARLNETGVGIGAMRERCEELGGRFEINTAETGGVRILAMLPLEGVIE